MQRVCLSKDIAAVERDKGDDNEQECLLVTEAALFATSGAARARPHRRGRGHGLEHTTHPEYSHGRPGGQPRLGRAPRAQDGAIHLRFGSGVAKLIP